MIIYFVEKCFASFSIAEFKLNYVENFETLNIVKAVTVQSSNESDTFIIILNNLHHPNNYILHEVSFNSYQIQNSNYLNKNFIKYFDILNMKNKK